MIYLDHHAATPMGEAVLEAMRAAESTAWANPSSTHGAGRAARRLLEQARETVARALGARPADLVLAGGGTEACNLGVRAVARGRRRVVTTAVEHPAVAGSVARLGASGVEVVELAVPRGMPPTPDELASHLDEGTAVALQWVNHETGTRFPVRAYAAACRERGARLFIDATQAFGKLSIDVQALAADAVAVAGQKVGGPTGAGACWLSRTLDPEPVLDGGSQERGRRPGTPDTRNAVGFGAACAQIEQRLEDGPRITELRDRVEAALVELGAVRNGEGPRVGTVANLSFRGWPGAVLVAALDLEGVCVSTGAACSSGLQEPSAVLAAMYPDEQWRAGSAVRISLGTDTTAEDIAQASRAFDRVLARKPDENFNRI